LYAREDFTNVETSTLTWTQTDTLIPGVVTVVQVYRNGQILLPSQYTIPTSTSVVIAATSFKVGDNYTVIFPRGGGAGSGGGSGSLTSISAGTGIVVSPNPITTTGTVSADLTVMMELTDTTLLNLTTRFASKLNTTDTASLSSRIDAKGNGTVTSVATGYGLSGGTITTTGTLVLDSAVVFSQIRDSIVDVAIGNDTIKILKQEYAPATTSVLTWTVTPKFPIQLKQYILVFRNGQLLINDQYNLTDTNQITIVSNSFKIGANYTVVTVSGIGSVGTGVFPNPVYPDAGIALSTGTTWASSIPNNSTNWNTAFTDRLKWDGGSTGLVAATGRTSLGGTTIGQSMFTLTNPSAITFPRFNADNTVTARTAANFRSDIGAGTVTSVNIASGTPMSITNNTTTPEISMAAATGSVNGYLTSTDWTTFNNKQNALTFTTPLVNTSNTITINQSSGSANGFLTSTDWTTFNNKQNALSNASASVSGILTSTDWTTFNGKQNALTNPVTGTGISSFLPRFTGTSTLDSTRLFYSSGRLGINMDASEAADHLTSRFVIRDFGHNFKFDGSAAGSGYTTTFSHDDTGLKIGQSSNIRDIRFTLNGTSGLTISNNSNSPARAVGIGNDSPSHQLDVTGTFRATGATTLGSTLAVTGDITEAGYNVLTNLDTVSLSSRIDLKQNILSLTTTGTSGAATLDGSTLNIPQYTGGSGTVTNVSGTGAISVINPTTTPVISVATAAFGTAGIVSSSGTQQFSGDKVFEGISQFNGRALFKDYTYVATRLAGLSSTDRFATVTIGSGLSLSSGTLSATGGGVTSVTASSPLSSSGGATPNITITDAGAAASGVVNTTTQSFAGNKTFTGTLDVSSTGTFGGRVKTNWLERNYAYSTSSSFTVSVNTTWQDINTSVLTTITLPNAATYPGKELHLRQTGAGSVQSASSNIIPFLVAPTGSTSNGILIPSGNVRAATLVSDGDNWIIMQRNN
jgi:fibronectin-binding autotransporter adhesin